MTILSLHRVMPVSICTLATLLNDVLGFFDLHSLLLLVRGGLKSMVEK